jgi:Raf kinase inhibitor-like YbhB/YbcL family protein
MWYRMCGLLIVSMLLCACGGLMPGSVPPTSPAGQTMPSVALTSTAFQEGDLIPKKYTCDGQDISPPLAWSGLPQGTKSLALICDDPDAPLKTWVHWVVFNMPATVKELPEGVPVQEKLAAGGIQGRSDFGKNGYGGPCPPFGTHRYVFKLYALDTELTLDGRAGKGEAVKAMEGHILAQGQLVGKYKRS